MITPSWGRAAAEPAEPAGPERQRVSGPGSSARRRRPRRGPSEPLFTLYDLFALLFNHNKQDKEIYIYIYIYT